MPCKPFPDSLKCKGQQRYLRLPFIWFIKPGLHRGPLRWCCWNTNMAHYSRLRRRRLMKADAFGRGRSRVWTLCGGKIHLTISFHDSSGETMQVKIHWSKPCERMNTFLKFPSFVTMFCSKKQFLIWKLWGNITWNYLNWSKIKYRLIFGSTTLYASHTHACLHTH